MEEEIRKHSKKRHKPRKRNTGLIVTVIILVIIILALVSAGLFYYYLNNPRLIKGSWDRKIDVTDEVTNNISAYISEATFGKDIDPSQYVDEIAIGILFVIDEDGSYSIRVSEEDYNMALDKANNAMKSAITDLLIRRMEISQIESKKSIDELVEASIGISLDEYIASYAPKLLPSIEELNAKYAQKGTYTVNKDIITLINDASESAEYSYLVSQYALMLNGASNEYVYTRREE